MSAPSDPRDPRDPQGRARPVAAVVPVLLVVVVTAVVVLLVTVAASTGPTEVFAGAGPDPERMTTEPTTTPTPTESDDAAPDVDALVDTGERGSLSWVGTVVRAALLVLVIGAVLLALVFYARRGLRRRRGSALVEAAGSDFAIVDPFAAVAAALAEDVERQDEALREGSARNGIVRAWLRFEQQAAAAGVPRHDWETSAEFTVRLLDSLHADPDATARLAELYRVARFSDHPVGEPERAAAAAALDRVRDALRSTRREGS